MRWSTVDPTRRSLAVFESCNTSSHLLQSHKPQYAYCLNRLAELIRTGHPCPRPRRLEVRDDGNGRCREAEATDAIEGGASPS